VLVPQKPNSEKVKMSEDQTIEWQRNKVYLPKYMTLISADQINNKGYFDFRLAEPPVSRIGLNYLTPRGNHICISQASYWLIEQLVELGKIDILDVEGLKNFLDVEGLRNMALEGRLKIIELNQKLRKEIKLDEIIQGKFALTDSRVNSKMPLIKMDFDLGERGVMGNLTAVLAPKPVPQTNTDIMRK